MTLMSGENTEDVDLDDKNNETLLEATNQEEEDGDLEEQEPEGEVDWKARALKAEGILSRKRTQAQKQKPTVEPKTNQPSVDPEELRLYAKGFSDEEIAQAKAIAKGKDLSLSEAVKDSLFETYQKDLKAKERSEKAKLNASKGSGQKTEQVFKSGMTAEEHRAAFKARMG